MSQLPFHNPLLERLPDYKMVEDVMKAMTYHPLQNVDVSKLTFVEKDALLTGEKVILAPTKKMMMAAMTWYGMLKTGLHNRNPVLVENKRRYFESLEQNKLLNEFPRHATSGLSVNVLKGPTGTGKTVAIQRFCAILPQVIEHGRDEAAGWVFHKQLVYLHVNLSHDGSRGGFMYSILFAMDQALGTQYATSIFRQNRTVEKLSVATIARLIAHHTGIIFIDESQLRNLVKSGQAELMQLFLLQIINSSIPIVISGNERAFDWLNYSQDLSRLILTETSHFHPIGALNEPDWELDWEALCRSIMLFYLLPLPPKSLSECLKKLFDCSGGIARLAVILWSGAQRYCLYHQKQFVTPDDIEDFYQGYSYSKIKLLADGFRYKNANLLSNYPDVDVSFYKQHWQAECNENNDSVKHEPPTLADSNKLKLTKKRGEQAKFKSQQTAEKNKRTKSQLLKETLAHEDMRMNGLINHNLDQLAALRQETED
ncbi:MAG TPA: ATP-binding protein [Methylotenera sp.]|nr:ATP-binding protein [Methylotenera sp.]